MCSQSHRSSPWRKTAGCMSWEFHGCSATMWPTDVCPGLQILMGSQHQPRFSHQSQHQIPVAGWDTWENQRRLKWAECKTWLKIIQDLGPVPQKTFAKTQQLLEKTLLTKTLLYVAEAKCLNKLSPGTVQTARSGFPKTHSKTGDVGIVPVPKPFIFTVMFNQNSINIYRAATSCITIHFIEFFCSSMSIESAIPSFIHLFIHSLIRSLVHYGHSWIMSFITILIIIIPSFEVTINRCVSRFHAWNKLQADQASKHTWATQNANQGIAAFHWSLARWAAWVQLIYTDPYILTYYNPCIIG